MSLFSYSKDDTISANLLNGVEIHKLLHWLHSDYDNHMTITCFIVCRYFGKYIQNTLTTKQTTDL